jgi:hypothetical protein
VAYKHGVWQHQTAQIVAGLSPQRTQLTVEDVNMQRRSPHPLL